MATCTNYCLICFPSHCLPPLSLNPLSPPTHTLLPSSFPHTCVLSPSTPLHPPLHSTPPPPPQHTHTHTHTHMPTSTHFFPLLHDLSSPHTHPIPQCWIRCNLHNIWHHATVGQSVCYQYDPRHWEGIVWGSHQWREVLPATVWKHLSD